MKIGFLLKFIGGVILAFYWIYIFISSFFLHEVSISTVSIDDLGDDIMDSYRTHAFVHALGFTLITLGWAAENEERKNRLSSRHKNRKGFDETRRI